MDSSKYILLIAHILAGCLYPIKPNKRVCGVWDWDAFHSSGFSPSPEGICFFVAIFLDAQDSRPILPPPGGYWKGG